MLGSGRPVAPTGRGCSGLVRAPVSSSSTGGATGFTSLAHLRTGTNESQRERETESRGALATHFAAVLWDAAVPFLCRCLPSLPIERVRWRGPQQVGNSESIHDSGRRRAKFKILQISMSVRKKFTARSRARAVNISPCSCCYGAQWRCLRALCRLTLRCCSSFGSLPAWTQPFARRAASHAPSRRLCMSPGAEALSRRHRRRLQSSPRSSPPRRRPSKRPGACRSASSVAARTRCGRRLTTSLSRLSSSHSPATASPSPAPLVVYALRRLTRGLSSGREVCKWSFSRQPPRFFCAASRRPPRFAGRAPGLRARADGRAGGGAVRERGERAGHSRREHRAGHGQRQGASNTAHDCTSHADSWFTHALRSGRGGARHLPRPAVWRRFGVARAEEPLAARAAAAAAARAAGAGGGLCVAQERHARSTFLRFLSR